MAHGVYTSIHAGWAKKVSQIIFFNNFVYCHPIFIILGTYTLQEICNRRMYS